MVLAEDILVNLLRFEVADLDLVHHVLFCVELTEPKVALGCLKTVVAFN